MRAENFGVNIWYREPLIEGDHWEWLCDCGMGLFTTSTATTQACICGEPMECIGQYGDLRDDEVD